MAGAHQARPAPAGLDLTWVGHATVLIDWGGYRVITDPVLTRRVAHLRRRTPVPDPATRDVDLVLLSHAHMDHLHLPSLRKLRTGTSAVTARGSARLLRRMGFSSLDEIAAGETIEHGPVRVTATPAVHKQGRGPHRRVTAPPVGFLIEVGGRRIYFAGDTDLFDDMATLAPLDVALLPIWGWGSSIGVGHLDPVRAARATEMTGARSVVPIHWGTYAPEDVRPGAPAWFADPVRRFREELAATGVADALVALDPGGSLVL